MTMTLVPRNRSLRPMTCVLRETTGHRALTLLTFERDPRVALEDWWTASPRQRALILPFRALLPRLRIRANEDLLRFFGNALDFARNEPLGTNVGRSCSLKLNRFTPTVSCIFSIFFPLLPFLSFFLFWRVSFSSIA